MYKEYGGSTKDLSLSSTRPDIFYKPTKNDDDHTNL